MKTTFSAIKPGETNAELTYYVNFYVESESGYCDYCNNYITIPSDYNWYKYKDKFDVTVNADYVLNYNTQGGSAISTTRCSKAETAATLNVTSTIPTKDGYTFMGWAETSDATTATYKGGEPVMLEWREGLGSAENPVSKTLYAVWEKDDENQDTTYTVIYTDGVSGEIVFPDEGYEGLNEVDSLSAFI